VIGEPPLLEGAVHVTLAEVKEATTALAPVGAIGELAATTGFDACDAGPVPTAFVAVTVKV
jgi:hypothetical protein